MKCLRGEMVRFEQPAVGVIVHIDKAGRNNLTGCVEYLVRFTVVVEPANLYNAISLNGQICLIARGLRTIDDSAVTDKNVKHGVDPFLRRYLAWFANVVLTNRAKDVYGKGGPTMVFRAGSATIRMDRLNCTGK